jgi:hypothetical protein
VDYSYGPGGRLELVKAGAEKGEHSKKVGNFVKKLN